MIKRIFLIIFILAAFVHRSRAQDEIQLADTLIINGETIIMLGDSVIILRPEQPIYWKKGGNFNLSIQQVSLANWSAGGTGSMALNTGLTLYANFKKDKKIWDTNLNINFGFNRQTDRKYATRKTNDNFIFLSKYGRELSKSWYLSTQIDARTQLLAGYRYFRQSGMEQDSRSRISNLLAPAYIQSSTGLNYKKELKNKDKVSIIGSPFTGRFTVVMDDSLSRAGAFGLIPGEVIRAEAGMSLTSSTDVQLLENIRWKADLNLFSNYESLGNMVVNFNSVISMKVNKFITTRIETILIYDEKVLITRSDKPPGPAIQLQNLINFGIGLEF